MKSVFIKEQTAYTRKQLLDLFSNDSDDQAVQCIKKLKEYGILKTVKVDDPYADLSELEDLEIIVDEDNPEDDNRYVFSFVGVVIVNGFVLKCFPKYILSKNEPLGELKQVMQVLEKFNSREQIIKMYMNDHDENKFNRLATMIYFLNDYYENGVYSNQKDIIEINGSGEINWNRTINETFAILKNNRPYYTELKTLLHRNDDMDFFKRLHESILTICSQELESLSLLDLLGLTEVDLNGESLEELGGNEYILYQLDKEMNVEFNTRKLSLLKTMSLFIENDGTLLDKSSFNLYGTNAFHVVWEKVCAAIMGNKLDKKLKSVIEKPKWIDYTGQEHKADKTLIPDIISVFNNTFIIFDAKYYNLTLEPNKLLAGNPGVGDISKQYLYQLAYKDYIKRNGYTSVKNCFLMPTEGAKTLPYGFAELSMLKSFDLENIQIRKIPAERVYTCYLTDRPFPIEELKL